MCFVALALFFLALLAPHGANALGPTPPKPTPPPWLPSKGAAAGCVPWALDTSPLYNSFESERMDWNGKSGMRLSRCSNLIFRFLPGHGAAVFATLISYRRRCLLRAGPIDAPHFCAPLTIIVTHTSPQISSHREPSRASSLSGHGRTWERCALGADGFNCCLTLTASKNLFCHGDAFIGFS